MDTQTKQTHTPGPWRYEQATKTIRSEPANYWIATVDSWDGMVNNEADGRLLAAAPALVTALQVALKYLNKADADGMNTVVPVRKAIELAESTLALALNG